jgi:hypothetical protein
MSDAPAPAREASRCACCGCELVTPDEGIFTRPKVGSPKRFCDPSCRQAAYRRRRAGVAEDVPSQSGGRGRRLQAGASQAKETER